MSPVALVHLLKPLGGIEMNNVIGLKLVSKPASGRHFELLVLFQLPT